MAYFVKVTGYYYKGAGDVNDNYAVDGQYCINPDTINYIGPVFQTNLGPLYDVIFSGGRIVINEFDFQKLTKN